MADNKSREELVAELAEVKSRYGKLLEEGPTPQRLLKIARLRDALFVLDKDISTILDCNPSAVEIFGYDRDEVVGQTTGFLHADTQRLHSFRQKLFPAIANEGSFFLDGFEMRRKSGALFWTEQDMVPLEFADGEAPGWIWAIRDISERRRLEVQLLHSQKMEAVGTLAGGVAHEINNILAVVIGLGSVLEKELPPGDQKHRDITEILTAARRGSAVTRNLLGFARQTTFRKTHLQLQDVVERVIDILKRTIPKQITITTDFEEQLADVDADGEQLSQVVMDLCLNAIDAMAGRGTLRLTTRNAVLGPQHVAAHPGLVAGHYVRLRVIDDGHGMNPETISRAFEPFYSTKGVGEGSGLGLSTAYGVLKAHGGLITLDSTEGQGCTVTVLLPAVELDEDLAQGSEEEQPVGTVLLVDDEEMIRGLGKRLLRKLGYEAISAAGGVEAVEIFAAEHEHIDLVMLDLAMPVMDGHECFERLKEIDPDVRVVVCTGFGSGRTAELLLARGARAFVSKPFDIDQLAEALEAVSQAPV